MNEKRKKKGKIHVKPHERTNPKSDGKHYVSGHTRDVNKKQEDDSYKTKYGEWHSERTRRDRIINDINGLLHNISTGLSHDQIVGHTADYIVEHYDKNELDQVDMAQALEQGVGRLSGLLPQVTYDDQGAILSIYQDDRLPKYTILTEDVWEEVDEKMEE